MRIAIDLDGTAWKHRQFFSDIVKGLQAAGHKVGILTAHNWALQEADLKLFQARGFNKPDFYYAKTAEEAGIPSRTWKLTQMKKHEIDFLFDDFDTDKTIQLVHINEAL